MDLRENSDINNSNIKKLKKSIHPSQRVRSFRRIDLFLLVVILIILAFPIVKGLLTKPKIDIKQKTDLYLSAQIEKFFGAEVTEMLLQEYAELNPGVNIVLTNNDDENQHADIFIFDDGGFDILVSQNALLELNRFTNYDSGTVQLAVPLVSFINLLFYNINLLIEAGFDSPPKTRDEFTAYSKTVSRGDFGDVYGTALSLSKDDHLALSRDIFSWFWASSVSVWTEEGPVLAVRAAVNEINFLENLNREGYLAPGVFETTGDLRAEQFADGNIALMIASSQIIPYLRVKMGDDSFGITTIPSIGNTGGNYNTGITAIYTGISAACENIEQAWDFLVFIIEKSSFFCEELKAVPGNISNITPGFYVKGDPFYSKVWNIFEASQIAEGFTGKAGAEEYKSIFLEELQSCFERKTTVSQAVARINQRWNAVFTAYNEKPSAASPHAASAAQTVIN